MYIYLPHYTYNFHYLKFKQDILFRGPRSITKPFIIQIDSNTQYFYPLL